MNPKEQVAEVPAPDGAVWTDDARTVDDPPPVDDAHRVDVEHPADPPDVAADPRLVRRTRPVELVTKMADGESFNRFGVLRDAVNRRVCREDLAQLEILARFAHGRPDFRAVTTVRLADRRRRTATFEVLHTPDGIRARFLPPVIDTTADDLAFDLAVAGDMIDDSPDHLAAPDEHDAVTSPEPTEPDRSDVGALLERVADDSPDLLAVFDAPSWPMRWSNNATREWLQLPCDAAATLIELLHEESQGHFVVKVLPALLSIGWWHGLLRFAGPGTDPFDAMTTLVAHRSPTGEVDALVLSSMRVSADAARRLRRSPDEQFAALVEHVNDLICVVEPAGVVRYASPAAATMLGYDAGELAGTRLVDRLHPDDRVADIGALVRVDADGNGEPVRLRLCAKDGTWAFIDAVVSDLRHNAAVGAFVLNAHDVTDRVQAHEELTELAYRDHGTGLPNRLRLLDRVTTLLETAGPVGIAMVLIDLDGFRAINEAQGTVVGDAILREVGARLIEAAGPDAVVARLRSDEFAVALTDVRDDSVAVRAADGLRVLLSQPYEIEGRGVRLTASVGVVSARAGDGADELLTRADRANALAKRSGGNRTERWGADVAEREQRRRRVETHLREAVEHGTWPVHYQPIVALHDGTIAGAEALLRVRDGVGALLNPAEFVDAAESSGLISRIGGQILRVACGQLSRWDAQLRTAAPAHVSVNISPRQLIDPGLATQVVAALEAHAIEPGRLHLELTESTVIGREGIIGDRIAYLRDRGVQVGLDEFGAGFSTLSYLKRFVIDFVKIDRSLVAGLGVDERDTAIVRATVQLAHSLGIRVIAVGVENERQLDLVRNLGCNAAQGYRFAPALPAEEFVNLPAGFAVRR